MKAGKLDESEKRLASSPPDYHSMNVHRRNRLTFTSLVLLVTLFGVPAWVTWRAVRQERLDSALIAAIKHNDTQAVVYLLRHGADVNAWQPPYGVSALS